MKRISLSFISAASVRLRRGRSESAGAGSCPGQRNAPAAGAHEKATRTWPPAGLRALARSTSVPESPACRIFLST